MKKFLKSRIFPFILGAIIFSGITASAYTILASDVTYTPSNSSWEVDNVKDAIDELYGNVKNLTLIGSADFDTTYWAGGVHSKTFDLSNIEDFNNITTDDIYLVLKSLAPARNDITISNSTDWYSIAKEYNQQNGILTLTVPKVVYDQVGVWVSFDVYLYK